MTKRPQIQVGDVVRISKRALREKGYLRRNFKNATFVVIGVLGDGIDYSSRIKCLVNSDSHLNMTFYRSNLYRVGHNILNPWLRGAPDYIGGVSREHFGRLDTKAQAALVSVRDNYHECCGVPKNSALYMGHREGCPTTALCSCGGGMGHHFGECPHRPRPVTPKADFIDSKGLCYFHGTADCEHFRGA